MKVLFLVPSLLLLACAGGVGQLLLNVWQTDETPKEHTAKSKADQV